MSTSTPTTAGHRPPLATPVLAEAECAELGQQLENYLAGLVDYCDRQAQAPDQFTLGEFGHAHDLRQALDALLRYDAATAQLLDYYRTALTYAQQQQEAYRPTLEQVVGCSAPLPPAPPSQVVTSPQSASQPVHQVDIAAVQRFLNQPALQARAQLPADQRRALALVSVQHLPIHA